MKLAIELLEYTLENLLAEKISFEESLTHDNGINGRHNGYDFPYCRGRLNQINPLIESINKILKKYKQV